MNLFLLFFRCTLVARTPFDLVDHFAQPHLQHYSELTLRWFDTQVTLATRHHDYLALMRGVEEAVNPHPAADPPVCDIFTPAMFKELLLEMAAQGWEGLDELERLWNTDYMHRPAIYRFLRDRVGFLHLISFLPLRLMSHLAASASRVLS